jgi:DNA mismatch endonuclease (patch repair protein)
MDTRSPSQRSRIMAAVKGKNTAPELIVRRLAFRMGYRYRLHKKGLPGRPDLVFPVRHKVIFVHGCFWHGHGCQKGQLPKSRLDYWGPKIAANRERDARQLDELQRLGWKTLTLWQCELNDAAQLAIKVRKFLGRVGGPRIKRRGSSGKS